MYEKPLKLSEGDKVGIIAPSSPVKEPFRSQGLQKISEMGYTPVEAEDILSQNHFLAKSSQQGFNDIQDFFNNPEIRAIWAARGGYGSNLLLKRLKKLEISEPKIIIGSSDVSYLLWLFLDRFKMVVFYGPMAYSSIAEGRFDVTNLKAVLSGDGEGLKIPGRVLVTGKVSGTITGGCLSNLVSLLGTAYFPIIKDRVLLLEDVGERPYRLDRMLWQLSQIRTFSKIKALLLGQFPGCFNDPGEKSYFLERVEHYTRHQIPVIYDLPLGHSDNIHTIPLGVHVESGSPDFDGIILRENGVA